MPPRRFDKLLIAAGNIVQVFPIISVFACFWQPIAMYSSVVSRENLAGPSTSAPGSGASKYIKNRSGRSQRNDAWLRHASSDRRRRTIRLHRAMDWQKKKSSVAIGVTSLPPARGALFAVKQSFATWCDQKTWHSLPICDKRRCSNLSRISPGGEDRSFALAGVSQPPQNLYSEAGSFKRYQPKLSPAQSRRWSNNQTTGESSTQF